MLGWFPATLQNVQRSEEKGGDFLRLAVIDSGLAYPFGTPPFGGGVPLISLIVRHENGYLQAGIFYAADGFIQAPYRETAAISPAHALGVAVSHERISDFFIQASFTTGIAEGMS